jgi:DNA-nicking Smr family endonuclease
MKTFQEIFENWEKTSNPRYSPKESDKEADESKSLKKEELPVIDLHGLTEKDALRKLSDFIDANKKKSGIKIKIIHGAGYHSKDNKPVLKRAVKNYLDYSDSIKYHRPGRTGEGNHGVTIAIIR